MKNRVMNTMSNTMSWIVTHPTQIQMVILAVALTVVVLGVMHPGVALADNVPSGGGH